MCLCAPTLLLHSPLSILHSFTWEIIMPLDWRIFALGSAVFAALTAILGKVGVAQINSDLATFLRTIVILFITALILSWRQEWQRPDQWSAKSMVFLILSGVATGLSWLCYYRAPPISARVAGGAHR